MPAQEPCWDPSSLVAGGAGPVAGSSLGWDAGSGLCQDPSVPGLGLGQNPAAPLAPAAILAQPQREPPNLPIIRV